MLLTVHEDIFPQIGTGSLCYDPSLYPPATDPVFKAEASVSGEYIDISTIENWSLYGGAIPLDTEGIKDEIDTLVVAKTFASCTDGEKDIASEWFVVDKSDRDTRHTAAQQESNAEILIRNIHIQAPEKKIISLRDSIKNESAADIKISISNINKSLIWLPTPVLKVLGTPATIFTDIDISDDTRADIAHTAIFSVKITKSVSDARRDIFIRENGSILTGNSVPSISHEIKAGSYIRNQLFVPLDGNEICEYMIDNNDDTTVNIMLLGYIK